MIYTKATHIALSMWKKPMLKYIISVWLSMFGSSLLGIVDGLFLNLAGANAYLISGSAYILFYFAIAFFTGHAINCNREVSRTKTFNIYTFVVYFMFSCLITCILVLSSQELFNIMFSHTLLVPEIRKYFIPIALTIPLNIFLFTGTGISRGIGKPLYASYNIAIMLVLDVILNWVFIRFLNFDSIISAVAWATFYSEFFVSIAYLIIIFCITRHKIKYIFKRDSIRTSCLMGVEKLFSSTFVIMIQTYIVTLISNDFAILYMSFERYALPTLLVGHAIHEWVIYSYVVPKNEKNIFSTYALLFSCSLLYLVCIGLYCHWNLSLSITILFILIPIFWIERHLLGQLYCMEKVGIGVKVSSITRTILVTILFLLYITHYLTETRYIVILLLTSILVCLFMHWNIGGKLTFGQKVP